METSKRTIKANTRRLPDGRVIDVRGSIKHTPKAERPYRPGRRSSEGKILADSIWKAIFGKLPK